MSWLTVIALLMVGATAGFVMSCLLLAGKITDLERQVLASQRKWLDP